MYMMSNGENYGCKTLLYFASSSDACLLLCLKSKPGCLESLMKNKITMLLLPLPCCQFWILIFSPWHGACHLKIFARIACFLGKEFEKCHKTLKADWLPSSVFLLFLKVSQSAVVEMHISLAQSLWLPNVRASWISRKCNLLQSLLWRLFVPQETNIFW